MTAAKVVRHEPSYTCCSVATLRPERSQMHPSPAMVCLLPSGSSSCSSSSSPKMIGTNIGASRGPPREKEVQPSMVALPLYS